MKIKSVDHQLLDFEDGLPPIHLNNLQRVVVLAGPNGSGKTRLIRRIERCSETNGLMGTASPSVIWAKEIHKEIQLEGVVRKVSDLNEQFGTTYGPKIGVEFDPIPTRREPENIESFTFTDVPLHKLNEISLSDIEYAKGLGSLGGAYGITKLASHYIYAVQEAWWDATHKDSKVEADVANVAVTRYRSLQSVIFQLLRAELDRSASGHPTLFGRSITEPEFSHGQIALLRWAVAIHAHGTDPGKAILTLDEPENHLHPDAMIEVICRMIEVNRNGQLWIATHSVPLLAALFSRYPDDTTFFFLQNGLPTYAGRGPEQILLSLMGGADNIGALRQFIDLPEMLAVNRFAAECLLPPGVISEAGEKDPQVGLANSAIATTESIPVKVLDYGAGHGRLLEGLTALLGNRIAEQIDYVGWDVADECSPQCAAAIESAYGTLGTRWANDRNTLFQHHNAGSFRVAVMCNVLHEIDPTKWLEIFEPNGVLSRTLHADGRLVIVEDYLMPKGEHAHPFGFTLLDTEALKVLFRAGTGKDAVTVIDAGGRYNGRIKAHVIPAHLLPNVSSASRKQALELAASNALEQINKLREKGSGFKAGQAHAFWVQQFANCTIAQRNL